MSAAQARIASTGGPSRTIVIGGRGSAARATNAARASAAPALSVDRGGRAASIRIGTGSGMAAGTT